MTEQARLPRVLILGGGFGGLWAARGLAGAPVQVTLVDRTNHHLFQPLLYQVATAGLSAPDIAAPLRHILRRQSNVTVLLGEASRIDTTQQVVVVDERPIGYDWLVVATGSTHAYFGHDDWAVHARGLKTLDDAFAIRRQVLGAFEAAEVEEDPARRQMLMRFVVIGGGPTGVELAGTLAEIACHTLPSNFRRIDPRTAEVHLVEAGPRILATLDPALSASAQRQLERLGVRVHVGAAVTDVDATGVQLGERRLPANTVLWAAGVAASPLGRQLGQPVDRAGRVPVTAELALPDHPQVFVIGDLAAASREDGRPVPGVAPAAKQMGRHVAHVITARLRGKPSRPFRYRDFGNLATIGRHAAVVQLGRWRLRGAPAWWFWLLIHLMFLIGFRNRMVVLLDWAWSYWTYQRNARIITGQACNRATELPPGPPAGG